MKLTRKVSRLDDFVKGFERTDWWVGIDVHKRSYAVAVRRADGQIHTWTCPADPLKLIKTFNSAGLKPQAVAQEAGPTGYALARTLEAAGMRAIVAAPSRIPRPVTAGAKCDRLDCRRLAEFAARDMLKSIAVPNVQEEVFRGLVRRRQAITDQVRTCKQRLKSILLYYAIDDAPELANWSAKDLHALSILDLPEDLAATRDSLLEELAALERNRKQVDKGIRASVSNNPELKARHKYLTTVPGVGDRVALTFLAEVFHPERFMCAGEVTSYLGLAPMVHHSGEKTPRGRIRPVGQRRLRSLLVEAAWIWKRMEPQAQDVYNRILARTNLPQKAIVAVARRLAQILWRIALEQRSYYSTTEEKS